MATSDQTPSWLSKFEKPTTAAPSRGERKVDVGIRGDEASATRTETLTPLEAAEKRLTIEEKQRKADEADAAKIAAAEAKKQSAQERRQQLLGFLEDIQRARKVLSNPLATGPAAQLTGNIHSTPAASLEALVTEIGRAHV